MKLITITLIIVSFLATTYFRYIHGFEKELNIEHSGGIVYLLQNRMFST